MMRSILLGLICFAFLTGCATVSSSNLAPVEAGTKSYKALDDFVVEFGASNFNIVKGNKYIVEHKRLDMTGTNMLRIDRTSKMYIEIDNNGKILSRRVCGFSVGDMRCMETLSPSIVRKTLFSQISSTETQQSRLGFKGLKLDMTEEMLHEQYSFSCRDSSKEGRSCFNNYPRGELETIAHIKVKDIFLIFNLNRLIAITVNANNVFKNDLLAALSSKYGKPNQTETVTKQNKMGASFQGMKYYWNHNGGSISLSTLAGSIDEMSVSYATHDFVNAMQKSREASGKTNANDL